MMIAVEKLALGDILLLYDIKEKFYRHVAIVSEINTQEGIYKVIHWRGVGEPYAITERTLPSQEVLEKRGCQFECFRLHDSKRAAAVIELLKSWLSWSIPYSKTSLEKVTQAKNSFFSKTSDPCDKGSLEIDDEQTAQKNQQYLKEMQQLFEAHWLDVVKYAARRNMGVVRTKREGKISGFNCLGGILVALHTTYVLDLVEPLTNRWVSNAHCKESHPSSDHLVFESSTLALKSGVNQEIITQAIPPAFKLYAKLCTVDTFSLALLSDEKTIKYIGPLMTQKEEALKCDQEVMKNEALFFKKEDDDKRISALKILETKYLYNSVC